MKNYDARNDAVIKLARDSDRFFFPVCSVHPADGRDALEEVDRVAAAGAAWIKLHPNTQDFDVAVCAVAELGFTDEEQAAVFRHSAEALLEDEW
jgi:hypothetical protein